MSYLWHRCAYYWRLFWLFRKLHLMRTVEYRGNFLFWALISLIWTAVHFFFFNIISGVGNGIGGWSQLEMYVLFGFFNIIDAFTWSFFYHNMSQYTQAVFSGGLSSWLIKPADPQFMAMAQSNNYNNIFRLGLGVALLIWAVPHLEYQPTGLELVVSGGLLVVSLMLVYSLWFMLSTLSFYVERMSNVNDIIPSLRRIWQVPRSVYVGVFSWMFSVFLPLGLITSLPAEAVVGKLQAGWLLYFALFTIATAMASRWFFLVSLRRYTGVGG